MMLSEALCKSARRNSQLIGRAERQISSRVATRWRRSLALVHASRIPSCSGAEGRSSCVFTPEQSLFQYGRRRDASSSTTTITTTPSTKPSAQDLKDGPASRVETSINSDGICYVTLNRPEKLNALDLKMFEAIAETTSKLRNNCNIRAVILRGEGRAFCTGLDVVSILRWDFQPQSHQACCFLNHDSP